jgi:hypothetical protein
MLRVCQDRYADARFLCEVLSRFSDISAYFSCSTDNVIGYPAAFLFASSLPIFPFGHAMTSRSNWCFQLRHNNSGTSMQERRDHETVLNRKMNTANVRRCISCHVPYASLRANLCLIITPSESASNDSSVSMSVPGATHDSPSSS